jgi:hypothetical protein
LQVLVLALTVSDLRELFPIAFAYNIFRWPLLTRRKYRNPDFPLFAKFIGLSFSRRAHLGCDKSGISNVRFASGFAPKTRRVVQNDRRSITMNDLMEFFWEIITDLKPALQLSLPNVAT